MSEIQPVDARVPDEDHLLIEWSDGRKMVYPLDFLRSKCPCAQCVDEWTGEVRVTRDMFTGVTLKSLEEAGSYAFRIEFSDGHGTGIYTYKLLLEIGETPRSTEEQNPYAV